MVLSNYSVAGNYSFYCSRALHHDSMNEHELSLAIYIEVKIFQGSHVSMKIFYLEFYYQ